MHYNSLTKKWTIPFIMAPVNTRVVRRSNALLHHSYGEHTLSAMADKKMAACMLERSHNTVVETRSKAGPCSCSVICCLSDHASSSAKEIDVLSLLYR